MLEPHIKNSNNFVNFIFLGIILKIVKYYKKNCKNNKTVLKILLHNNGMNMNAMVDI